MENQASAVRSAYETSFSFHLGSLPWERGAFILLKYMQKTKPAWVIEFVITQLCWRAIDDWCKALRSIFLTDHSAHVSHIGFLIFTVLLVYFVLSIQSQSLIQKQTPPCLCVLSTFAFILSLGSPLTLSRTTTSASISACKNSSCKRLTMLPWLEHGPRDP